MMSKNNYIHEFFRMISLMKKKKWIYLFALILGCVVNSTSNVLSAFVNKNMINAAETGNMRFMFNGAILALIAFLIGILIFPFCIYLKVMIIKHVMTNVKLDVFRHIEKLPISYHEDSHSGELTSRLMNDINSMENALNDEMQMVGVSLIGGISSAIMMFSLDWRLSIITIVIGIISARINISFSDSLRELGNKIQNSLGVLNQHLVDIAAGFRTTKMFNIGSIITGRYISESNSIAFLNIKRAQKYSQLNGLNYLFGILSMSGIYILGALMVIKGMADLSTVVAIVGLQKGVNFMFMNFGRFFAQLQTALAGSSRVFDLLDEPQEQEKILLEKDTNDKSMIAMKNVSFSYEGQKNLLENFNINISEGKVIALVGASGGGKSTIIKLLLGFYPLKTGNIIIDGKSISQYSLRELRELMAYVPQDIYLFNGTIEDNIRYGRVNASREEIIEAAKKANAHNFIMKMPYGYNTNVGERGAKLSGGQKQCISIARAFVKNAPILLLDEATSSLDSESEQLVKKGLEALVQGKTALIVAHRLSTIKNANAIYVIENGRVSESGTHDKLLAHGGLYKKLYNNQLVDSDTA